MELEGREGIEKVFLGGNWDIFLKIDFFLFFGWGGVSGIKYKIYPLWINTMYYRDFFRDSNSKHT